MRRKRLVHRSRYRGVKESDLLFGQFADDPSGAAWTLASSTATRRCSTSPTRSPGLGLRPAARARRGTTTTCSRCCARFEPGGVTHARQRSWPSPRRRARRPRRAGASPAPYCWPSAPRAWRRSTSPRGCAVATQRASCTSPATAAAHRLARRHGRASSRPRSRSSSIPAWDCLPYDRISPNAAHHGRAAARAGPAGGRPGRRKPRLVLTTANAHGAEGAAAGAWCARRICGPGPAPASIATRCSAYLERNGYHRTSAVVEAGDYAVRGGLVDVFPSGCEQPRAARLLRLDAGIDPHLRSADPALAGQGRLRSS